MEKIITRKAVLEDLEILLGFEQGVITAERPFDVTINKGHVNYYDLKQMILSDDVEVIVAEIDSKIIACGYALIKKARPYLDHKIYTYLGFMYTDPDYRGRGMNQKIVEALEDWSTSKGIKEIRLTVYSDNIPAIKAYEKVGFKQHIVEMRMDRD